MRAYSSPSFTKGRGSGGMDFKIPLVLPFVKEDVVSPFLKGRLRGIKVRETF
jgi:hypothetical protein